MAREINFIQIASADGRAVGEICIELPGSLIELGEEVKFSLNGKVMPFYEGNVEFSVILDDGTSTVVAGTLALWYPRNHVKAAVEAVKKAREEEARKAREEELRMKRLELLKTFSAEQIQALAALGLLEKEGE